MSEWKKAKKMAIRFGKARIPLTEAEKNLLKYLKKKNDESK
jgi:hypothetical protein